jgi:hypothetical protein
MVYLLLIVLTMVLSATPPGGAYYRMLGVNPLAAMIGMASEGAPFYGVLFLLGTAWWFFIGAIGWSSKSGTMSRPIAALGALLSVFSALAGIGMTTVAMRQDHEFSLGAVLQYACVGLLCLGALIVTIYSAKTAFGLRRPQSPE